MYNRVPVIFIFSSPIIYTMIAALKKVGDKTRICNHMFQIKQTLLFQKLSENIRQFQR
jgi:hypothetical protein